MKKEYDKPRHVTNNLQRKIMGISKYVEARLSAENQGEVLIRWKGESIKFEDKTFGDADIFDGDDSIE